MSIKDDHQFNRTIWPREKPCNWTAQALMGQESDDDHRRISKPALPSMAIQVICGKDALAGKFYYILLI